MSKRFSVTVPDSIGQVIEKLARQEGSKPAGAASFIVETAVKEGLRSGLYPAEWAVLEEAQPDEQPAGLDLIDADALVKMLFKLKSNRKLTSADISLLENILGVAPGRLSDLAKNGNNDDAKSATRK